MNDLQRLKAMGITVWELRDSDVFSSCPSPKIDIPDHCRLLFSSQHPPNNHEIEMFTKILATMKLTLGDVLYLPPEALHTVQNHQLSWCWLADEGENMQTSDNFANVNWLQSASLAQLASDVLAKKQLWQQIKVVTASL